MPATATVTEGKRLPGARLAGRVADARHAHRETGRPDCGPDGRHLQMAASAAKSIRTARALEGRGQNPASPELRLTGYREIEHEVESGAVPG